MKTKILVLLSLWATQACGFCCFKKSFISTIHSTLDQQQVINDELIHACRWGDLAAVRAKLAAGAHVEAVDKRVRAGGYTALMCAVTRGYEDAASIVALLLEHGANVNAVTGKNDIIHYPGMTPCQLARLCGRPQIAEIIEAYPRQKARWERPELNAWLRVVNRAARLDLD